MRENRSLEGLDRDVKKSVHVEIVRQSLDEEKIPNNFLQEAKNDLYKEKKDPLTDLEQIKVKDLALKKQAQKMQEEYEKAVSEDSKKNPPGSSAQNILK